MKGKAHRETASRTGGKVETLDNLSFLDNKEKQMLDLLMKYGENDDFSMTYSEINSHLSETDDIDIASTKLLTREFIARESSRKRAFYITDRGWIWISKNNL